MHGKYIKFFSDSRSSLQALSNRTCKNNTVLDTHNILNSLAKVTKGLRLAWIKAHIGLIGNELADEYAKLGTIDTTVQILTNTTQTEIKKYP